MFDLNLREKKWHQWLALGLVVLIVALAGCAAFQMKPDGGAPLAADAINSVAPLLPPPFGVLAGLAAGALTAVASVGANKASNKAYKEKKDPGLLVKLATDHSSLILAATTLLPILRASGIIHMSDAELAVVMAALAVPVGTKKTMRRKPA